MKFIISISCIFVTFASKTLKSKIAQVEFTFTKLMSTHVSGGASIYKGPFIWAITICASSCRSALYMFSE